MAERVWAVVTRRHGGPLGFALCIGVPPGMYKHDRRENGGEVVDCFELLEAAADVSLGDLAGAYARDKAAALRKPVPPPAPREKPRPLVDLAPLPCPAYEDRARVALSKTPVMVPTVELGAQRRAPGASAGPGGGTGGAGASRRATGRGRASPGKRKGKAR
jgi:hypothetical protein